MSVSGDSSLPPLYQVVHGGTLRLAPKLKPSGKGRQIGDVTGESRQKREAETRESEVGVYEVRSRQALSHTKVRLGKFMEVLVGRMWLKNPKRRHDPPARPRRSGSCAAYLELIRRAVYAYPGRCEISEQDSRIRGLRGGSAWRVG